MEIYIYIYVDRDREIYSERERERESRTDIFNGYDRKRNVGLNDDNLTAVYIHARSGEYSAAGNTNLQVNGVPAICIDCIDDGKR